MKHKYTQDYLQRVATMSHEKVKGYRTLQEIGDDFNPPISKERVRQLLKRHGIQRLPKSAKVASLCGRCFLPLLDTNHSGLHLSCRKVTLICEVCGKSFERSRSAYNASVKKGYSHTWCSKSCQGRWVGRTHGFPVQPDTRKKKGDGRKFDYKAIAHFYQAGSHSYPQVADSFGCSVGTVRKALKEEKARYKATPMVAVHDDVWNRAAEKAEKITSEPQVGTGIKLPTGYHLVSEEGFSAYTEPSKVKPLSFWDRAKQVSNWFQRFMGLGLG